MPVRDEKASIFDAVKSLVDDKALVISEDTALIGEGNVLNSMKLVELCLMLEDIASEQGFTFDWTSESAMSRSRGMFRTAGSLADEFLAQRQARS